MIGHGTQHRSHLWILLIFVVVLQFGYPITEHGKGWTALYSLAYVGMVLFGIALAANQRITRSALALIGTAALVVVAWFLREPPEGALMVTRPIVLALFQLALLIPLGRYLLGGGPSDDRNDVLLVALNTYLVLGAVFASLFQIIETLDPGAFVDNSVNAITPQGLVYGSYTTLTTLGYGDVVAVNSWARSLMTFEAVIGPLFVAIVITRLIGSSSGQAVARLIDDQSDRADGDATAGDGADGDRVARPE